MIIDQLNKLLLKLGRYEQYQAIAHANEKVENANLKGLYQAFTLNTKVVLTLVRSKNTKDVRRHSNPK